MNIHALVMKLSGTRPRSVVDIVSKPLIWNQINTVYSLEFCECCEGFQCKVVLAGQLWPWQRFARAHRHHPRVVSIGRQSTR